MRMWRHPFGTVVPDRNGSCTTKRQVAHCSVRSSLQCLVPVASCPQAGGERRTFDGLVPFNDYIGDWKANTWRTHIKGVLTPVTLPECHPEKKNRC